MKMGCVVKGHLIEMPINLSLDIFITKTIHQYVHFYKSGRKKAPALAQEDLSPGCTSSEI